MSSSAPKRRLDVRQQTPQRVAGKRAAQRRRSRASSFTPTPAMAGAFALVLAAFGAAVVGGADDSNSLRADEYQVINRSYTGPDQAASEVDVSRSFDRATLDKQAKAQAEQTQVAQQDLAAKVGQASEEFKANRWVIPVTGYRLSARFGQRSGLWSTVHTGLDFAGPSGSTIVSVAGGTVISADYEGAYGNRTVIRLDDGTEIWYCHQSRFGVSVGDKVLPGQTIGFTGSTGNVTGPHLHLEVHPGGGPAVDPFTALVEHDVTP